MAEFYGSGDQKFCDGLPPLRKTQGWGSLGKVGDSGKGGPAPRAASCAADPAGSARGVRAWAHSNTCCGSQRRVPARCYLTTICASAKTGATSTRRLFPQRMKWFHCRLLLVLVGAIALFAVGPQMGSLDDDNDGSPDIPVVVAVGNPVCDVSRALGKNQSRQQFQNSVVPAVNGTQSRDAGIDQPVFVAHDGRSALQSFCLLRC